MQQFVESDEVAQDPSAGDCVRALYEQCLLSRHAAVDTTSEAREPPRTTHVYPATSVTPHLNPALAQGSGESSLLEALVYCRHHRTPALCVANESCHDDEVTIVFAPASLTHFHLAAPPDGAEWAPDKMVAVGPNAARLVSADPPLAVKAAPSYLVFGVPIGDAAHHLRSTWLPGFVQRCDRIRSVAHTSLHAALVVAGRLRGPGAMAMHMLRALQPVPEMMEIWAAADDAWVDLYQDLAQQPHQSGPRTELRSRIFATTEHGGLGAAPAADEAEVRFLEGIRDALPALCRILRRNRLPSGDVLHGAGVPAEHATWDHQPGRAIAWVDAEMPAAVGRLEARQQLYAQSVARAARGPVPDAPRPCMALAWLRAAPVDGGRVAWMHNNIACTALCRALALPTLAPPAERCPRCGAPPAGPDTPTRGPRAAHDLCGEHSLSCQYGRGGSNRRHDSIVYALKRVATRAGRDARVRGGPCFPSRGVRPQDLLMSNTTSAGLAVDVTLGSRHTGELLAAREQTKIDKYKKDFLEYPELTFCPFAIELDGRLGSHAWELVQTLARERAVGSADAPITYQEALADFITELSVAFVRAVAQQIGELNKKRSRWRDGLLPP